jgi:hypothetical protein
MADDTSEAMDPSAKIRANHREGHTNFEVAARISNKGALKDADR